MNTESLMSDERRIVHDSKEHAVFLTPEQRKTLDDLKMLGWELKFVRKPLFQQPVPVVIERKTNRYAVIEEDGSLNDNPGFKIRD